MLKFFNTSHYNDNEIKILKKFVNNFKLIAKITKCDIIE